MPEPTLKIRIWQPPSYIFLSQGNTVVATIKENKQTEELQTLSDPRIAKFVPEGGLPINVAERVEVPPEGTSGWIETYYKGKKYPQKGLVDLNFSSRLNIAKRIHVFLITIATTPPIKWLLPLFFLFPPKIQDIFIENTIKGLGYITDWVFEKKYINPNYLCPAARALYGSIYDLPNEYELNKIKKWLMFWVHFLEGDQSYRYRAQERFERMNRDDMKKNPRKEIVELLREGATQEKQGMRDKWEKVAFLVNIILFLRPKYATMLGKFLSEMPNMDLDEGDWYWCSFREDYDFRGMSFEERVRARERMEKLA